MKKIRKIFYFYLAEPIEYRKQMFDDCKGDNNHGLVTSNRHAYYFTHLINKQMLLVYLAH